MSEHRYILEPYRGMNTRYKCPYCDKRKKFSRYIDTETGEHIHPTVGKCERVNACGIHVTPKQYFQDNNISLDTPKAFKSRVSTPLPKAVSFIPDEAFWQSLQVEKPIKRVAETNNFIKFLVELFGDEIASQLVSRYFIGSSKHWKGATVFWQIDGQGKVRTGKIMLYNPATGNRVKNLEPPIYWAHKALKQPEFELRQCLFGEHLLIDKAKDVAVVESEKTAIIASIYLPQFIWVAVGSLTNLNADKCKVLKGRTVMLFPDLNGYSKWMDKANELSYLATFIVSDLLERKATEMERKEGLDIADYLIRFDIKRVSKSTPLPDVKESDTVDSNGQVTKVKQSENHNWQQDVVGLQNYFNSISLSGNGLQLNNFTMITDVSTLLEGHFSTLNSNLGNRIF